MSLAADLKTIYHLALHPVRGNTHAERLESFYGGQAASYDAFRRRLLQGREALYAGIDVPSGAVWIEMGGGTGNNLEYLGTRIGQLSRAYIVDLAPSLLAQARSRIAEHGWTNVVAVEADATQFIPDEGQADVVTFSYALTMIPDWFAALEQAARVLRPGGQIAVVDFYVARKHVAEQRRRHGWWTRSFWPAWFALDNVFLSADHLPFLLAHFEPVQVGESVAKVPYVPWGRVPYYTFIGRKR
ncbi:MAG: class I SAM-dependent methyltransferase [Pirellulales bacterium]|nr:class I SAM-dependent methyltransferase [Pirellulales bacterium]